MKKQRIKHPVVPVPATLEEAAEFVSRIGKEQREIIRVQTELNEKVEKLKAGAMAKSKIHETNTSQLVEGLFAYAEAHRDELTDGGKRKTVEVPTGLFGWRLTPPAVSLRNVEKVLELLKSLSLFRFIRKKEEIDKEAMLKDPDIAKAVKGVTISQREEFIVKPAELEVEIIANVNKLKKQ
jgi:phage host-nuclease inhibitor protein Gam